MRTSHLVIIAWALALAYVAIRFPIAPMNYDGTEIGGTIILASAN